ncbi:tetratricopeptide repeat protein [Parafrankia sp. FMc6]|uniref:tetratricopeptide repeat protein n=1 Tax=Parafrankia soli TaxID=2599596 RepID=UPI0034D764E7
MAVAATQESDPILLREALNYRGNALHVQGKFDEAVRDLERAMELLPSQLRSSRLESTLLHNFGLAYFRQGKYRRAEECHRKDQIICRVMGDVRGEAQVMVTLGDTLRKLEDFEKASTILEAAADIFELLGDVRWLSITRLNLALSYQDARQPAVAYIIYLLSAALQANRELHETHGEALASMNLGWAYFLRCPNHHIVSAQYWTEQAQSLFRKIGATRQEAQASLNIGGLYAMRGDISGARSQLEQALAVFAEHGMANEARVARSRLKHIGKSKTGVQECSCQLSDDPKFRSVLNTWLEDLPHAMLRGDNARVDEFLFMIPRHDRSIRFLRWRLVDRQCT